MIVDHLAKNDPIAHELMGLAAGHVDALGARLVAFGAHRLVLAGGLAKHIEPWLADETRRHLVQPTGDALDGALRLAGAAAHLAAGDARLFPSEHGR
jgi:glucosamine kinase